MSDEPVQETTEPGARRTWRKEHRGNFIGGITLVVLGILLLLGKVMPEFRFEEYWPVILIVIGAAMLLTKRSS